MKALQFKVVPLKIIMVVFFSNSPLLNKLEWVLLTSLNISVTF